MHVIMYACETGSILKQNMEDLSTADKESEQA